MPSTPARNQGSEWPDPALLYKKGVEDVDLYVKSVDFEDKSERLKETPEALLAPGLPYCLSQMGQHFLSVA